MNNKAIQPAQEKSHTRFFDSSGFELAEMRQQLEAATLLTACIIEDAAEGIMITDMRNIIRSVNPAFERITGYKAEEVIGRTPAMFRSGYHDGDFYRAMWDMLEKTGHWQGEIWNRHKSGETYPEWLSISAVRHYQQNVSYFVGIFSDAHTQESIIERLQYMAYYDGLTGLPNRRLFIDRLNMGISNARRERHKLAVMFVDLDQFKQINDSLGHGIGDGLLKGVSQRMKGCLRDVDTLARLAGDEFTVVLPSLFEAGAAGNVAEKFLACFADPLEVEGHHLRVTASIGIYPDDGEDADSLIQHADAAMYRIKESGRNGYQRYEAGMTSCPLPGSGN
ncbi:MAG: sensor domain-containing diguanylate cyclase [Sideroxydans sp.]|nr:sensor domain-containing diguanylate cyclase [Sideroxydans sp.]